jgi:transposase
MPPQYVKAYVKTNKHDAADAEACCEAVQRPSMRFVPIKTEAQQATLMLHRVRDQLIGQRTATINALHAPLRADHGGRPWEPGAHLAELGIVAAQRQAGLRQLLEALAEVEDDRIPPLAREVLQTDRVSLGTPSGGLAWAGPQAARHRRQGAQARPEQTRRRGVSAHSLTSGLGRCPASCPLTQRVSARPRICPQDFRLICSTGEPERS